MISRQQAHELLDGESGAATARRARAVRVALTLLGIAAVALSPLYDLPAALREAAAVLVALVAALFAVEYALRLWAAPERAELAGLPSLHAGLRHARSPAGLVELLAAVPALVLLAGLIRPGDELAAGFALLWALRLASLSPGVATIGQVIAGQRRLLGAVAALSGAVLVGAATVLFFAERAAQPQVFGSLPAALGWALTLGGAGDAGPQTLAGRLAAGGLMLAAVAAVALLAGIFANGFAEETKRRDVVRVWDLVARVPFFAGLGAAAIGDVASRLQPRSYPPGAVVVRRGAPGDAMYFIVAGEVEVRLVRPVTLRSGAFFGEMALLDRRPRSADVVTATPCTLLVLHAGDFHEVAARQPALVAAIAGEAKRRQAANRAAAGGEG